MQYTPHYNLNLPEGSDIVNPLVQDNPNYSAIDTALYDNKLRVVGTATHVKTGTNHAITLGDSDINQFKFVATGDYASGDTFTVDGVTVTPRITDGSSIPTGAFKINSTVLCILDGTILNLINAVSGPPDAANVPYDNTSSGLAAANVQDAIDEVINNGKWSNLITLNSYISYMYCDHLALVFVTAATTLVAWASTSLGSLPANIRVLANVTSNGIYDGNNHTSKRGAFSIDINGVIRMSAWDDAITGTTQSPIGSGALVVPIELI